MKSLIAYFLGNNNTFSYVLAAYQPIAIQPLQADAPDSMDLLESDQQADAMSIDNIYQSQ